ncbi:MAG: ExbD/TolR family protein [Gemmatimonadales bacterium]
MRTSAGGSMNEINVTPMIDVLLVLLIIFMISQPLSRMTLSVQVPPPAEPTNEKPEPSTQIVLEMPDNGTLSINGQPVPQGQLDARLHAIFDPRPAKVLFIKPGQNRVYGDVIGAMDVARGAGIQVIGFTPKEADQAAPAG